MPKISGTSGADVRLVFGASEASYGEVTKDLLGIIDRIEKDGNLKVKIGIGYKDEDLKKLRTDIKEITDSISKTLGSINLPQFTRGGVSGDINSSLNTAISNISQKFSDSNIGKIQQSLKGLDGISGDAATQIAKAVSDANVQITAVETSISRIKGDGEKLLSLNISGKNELGQTVKYLATYDSKTGEVSKELVKIKQQWNDITASTKAATQEAATNSTTVGKTLGDSLNESIGKIEILKGKLKSQLLETQDSNARIAYNPLYGSEAVFSSISNTGAEKTILAREAIESLLSQYTQLQNTITADTSAEDFNKQMQRLSQSARLVFQAIGLDEKQIRELQKAERESLSDTNALSKAIVGSNRAYKQATEALQKYTAAKNGRSSREYTELEGSAEALRVLNERLNTGSITNTEYTTEVNNLRASIQKCTAIIKANGEAHLSLGDKIKSTAAKFTQYFTISKVVMYAWRATRQMVQATIELNDAFTQLKIVTGASDAEMAQFSDRAVELAKNLGQSVASVTSSIETFSRLGYNLDESSTLAKYATILANTASVSVDEATTGLTSIIKGFNLDVSNSEHVADVLIKVGQEYAVSAGEMMEAYERSGAALNATNTSFEKSAGLIAAANAAVQDSSVVGTALKTVSARIRGKMCLNIA